MGRKSETERRMGTAQVVETRFHRCVIYDLGRGQKLTFRLSFKNTCNDTHVVDGHWHWEVTELDLERVRSRRLGHGPVRM